MAPSGISEQLYTYPPDNMFNANEFRLQFRLSLDLTIADHQLSGWKNKYESTCPAGCSTTGSALYPLCIILPFKEPSGISAKVSKEAVNTLALQFKDPDDTRSFV